MRAVELVVERARDGGARVVGVTGGVGAGKSTLAAAVATALGDDAVVVGTDGFLLPNAALEARGLSERKGFPESFDAAALSSFLDAVLGGGRAVAPTYSHLAYDVVASVTVDASDARVVVLEGLHLGHPALGVRDRLDLLVHLDAADDLQRGWYLQRFQALRTEAAADPGAFLHPYTRTMSAEELDAMALAVWDAVNLRLLHEEVRPHAEHADLVLTLGPDHDVV